MTGADQRDTATGRAAAGRDATTIHAAQWKAAHPAAYDGAGKLTVAGLAAWMADHPATAKLHAAIAARQAR